MARQKYKLLLSEPLGTRAYTGHDVDTVFAPELPGLDREQIRQWYNGYNWFEFKVVELSLQGRALQQIKTMHYADKYQGRGYPVHLMGVEFSKASRHIVGFEVETI